MEITFKSDTKQRNRYFTGASFAHPAKMVLPLQRWLIENYTKPGDVVLDPMAGCGTLLIACTMGRNVILVELEDKFVQMQQDNWAKIQTIGPEMGYEMGTATILQGDARNLEGILADVILTSPPYANQNPSELKSGVIGQMKESLAGEERKEIVKGNGYSKSQNNIGNLPYGSIDAVIKDLHNGQIDGIIKSNEQILPGVREVANSKTEREGTSVSLSKETVLQSGMPHSQSEPQAQTSASALDKRINQRNRQQGKDTCREDEQNKDGAESPQNLTSQKGNQAGRGTQSEDSRSSTKGRKPSPMEGWVEEIPGFGLADPENEGFKAGQLSVPDMRGTDKRSSPSDSLPNQQGQQAYESSKSMPSLPREGNRTNPQSSSQILSQVDVVISSPPYEQSLNESKNTTSNLKREERLRTAGHQPKEFMGGIGRNASLEDGMRYSKDSNNIGNLKGESYLQAMALVYSQCFKVLRPQGLLCLVVKPFIRNKQVVRLEDDTQRLCEQCGFTLVEKHHRLLTSMSFWRTLYYQKNPTVERVDKEYILCFAKP